MSSEKVKVFALAKRYGFKSSDFVIVLRDIGFPVSSYQASIDAWDVPVIEERMLRGQLIEPSQATMIEEPEPAPAKEETSGWKVVIEAPRSAEEAEADEAEPAVEEEEEEPVAEPAVVAEAEPPVAEPAAEEAAVEPEPAAQEPAAEEPVETEPVVAEATTAEAPEPVAGEAAPEEPAAEPAIAEAEPAAAEPVLAESGEATATAPGAETEAETTAEGTPTLKPRPRSGATKVGRIDLAALGLVKAAQAKGRKNVTFTDIRDRETSRRHQQRTKQREQMQRRRRGLAEPKQVSTQERKSVVVLEPPVTVKSFSQETGVAVNKVLAEMMRMGSMATINEQLDEDTVEILATEFAVPVRIKQQEDIEESLMEEITAARDAVDDSKLAPRPPVIAFLGHVDHGKTSLIDVVRSTRVAAAEAGGITQHIGAYQITTKSGRAVTILDTPGHEAFTALRARGAQSTDIVILVVAADDGVMPQTEEAASHAREAGTPIIVAINKCDLPAANPDKVKAELAGLGLQPEEWGGDVGMVEVSALQKAGIDDLLDRVQLETELLDLKAHEQGDASGVVLEAKISEGRGKVSDILVQDGTLRVGDVVLAGPTHGKIRRMFDAKGKAVKSAGPSTPVEILGLNDLPPAGETFYVVRDLEAAKDVSEKRLLHLSDVERGSHTKASLENLFERMEQQILKRVRLVVKADVQGSLEVLKSSLQQLNNNEVIVDLVHSGVGGITESDVVLAETAEAVVIGFNVGPDAKARNHAEKASVEIRRYSVIYELLEDIQTAMVGLLDPEQEEIVRGHAEVRKVFRSSRFGAIAGCAVVDGEVQRAFRVRVLREGKPVFEGELESLRREKDDVRSVKAGNECGIKVSGFDEVQDGDVLEIYELVQKERTLESAS